MAEQELIKTARGKESRHYFDMLSFLQQLGVMPR